jgi:hypothetical protein
MDTVAIAFRKLHRVHGYDASPEAAAGIDASHLEGGIAWCRAETEGDAERHAWNPSP